MSKPKIDGVSFHRRLRFLIDKWNTKNEDEEVNSFSGASSILFLSADPDKQPQYTKYSTLQTWLLGFEFPKTAIVLTKEKVIFLTSANKAAYLEALKDSSIPDALPVEVITFTKDEAVMKEKSEELIKTLAQPEFQPIGTFPKDKVVGGFYDMWEKIKANHSDNWKEVDATLGIAEVLCYKEDSEIKLMQSAGKTTVAMAKYMVKQVVAYADKGVNISHIDLSRKIEDLLFNTNKLTKLDIQADINYDLLDWAHMPCIQSGGTFDLKYHAASNKQNLYSGVIICSLGVRYSSYCTYETRTLFINATKKQEENYKFLMDTYNHTLNSIKVGMKFSELYKIAQDYVAENRPDLEAKFNKNCGFVIGIELRENTHVISAKCDQVIEHNTCLVFNIGFTDLENPEAKDSRGKQYALSVGDTIRVTHSQPSFLTIGGKKLSDICYSFEDNKPSKPGKATSENGQASKPQNSAILQTKFRSQAQEEETPEQRRRTHQQELFEKKNRDGLLRYQDDGRDGAVKDSKAVFKSFESYKRETAIPREVRSNNIVVDARNETVILPINGYPTPFHINTIKNVSKNDEGNMVYLRVNFVTPGQGVSKKDDMPFPNPEANFIRSMTYRSSDTARLTEIYKRITDLKKEIAKKETEKKEMADIVEQDKLIVVPGRKPPHLSDVYIRPVLEGKKYPGELEIHSNGIRFLLPRSNRPLDILYSNIKHFFFQPCDGELLVLLHFHLKNPIMIGKKKTKDVQFYRETSDVTFDETGNRRRQHFYGDDDEMEAEMEEKRMMQALNKEFHDFGRKISDASHGEVDLDIPFRDLGFHGVPFRSSALLQPTTECLVFLSDMPFLVITLDEIELAHLERVQFGLKNFDLVLVFKDFSKAPVHINTISTKDLEGLKEWLDSVDVMYTEGQLNLNWSTIMKTIRDDPAEFFSSGGWSFLNDQAEDGDMSSEDPESEFEPESEYESDSEASFDSDEGSPSEEEPTESEEDYDDEEDEKPRKKASNPAPPVKNGKRPTQSSTLPLKKMKR